MEVSSVMYHQWARRAYRRMIIGKGVIDIHILEKPSDVFAKEALNLSIVEFRVNKNGADVRLHNIRESLEIVLATTGQLPSQVRIPSELSLLNSNSLVLHWPPFPPLRDLARIHDFGSR